MSKPRTHNHILLAGVIAVLLVALSGGASAAPLAEQSSGTAFTYQGQLTQTGEAVNGTCDFAFALWDDAGAGNQVGSTLNQTLGVAGGHFISHAMVRDLEHAGRVRRWHGQLV